MGISSDDRGGNKMDSQQPSLGSSIVYRTTMLYFLEAGLWSDCNWFKKGTGDNEDTFTDNLIKPLMSGAWRVLIQMVRHQYIEWKKKMMHWLILVLMTCNC
jgi:hypothetical protein